MSARTGMSDLITELRGQAEAGTADYTVAGVAYWSDDQLQKILDRYRSSIDFLYLTPKPSRAIGGGGSLSYLEYFSNREWWEQTTGGTAIFYVQDGLFNVVGTASYDADYERGVVTFLSNTFGALSYFVTGRVYDMREAAAEVWRKKVAHLASTAFDFSTDNHSVSRSQLWEHAKEMSSQFTPVSVINIDRTDVNPEC